MKFGAEFDVLAKYWKSPVHNASPWELRLQEASSLVSAAKSRRGEAPGNADLAKGSTTGRLACAARKHRRQHTERV
jgi:hypothetical protein